MVSVPLPRAVGVDPAEAHAVHGAALGLGTDEVGVAGAVGLAEGVATGDERDGLLVVHGHALERLADVDGGLLRIGLAVGALRVHVDEAHLHGAERTAELALAAVALVAEPLVLGAPVDLLRLPHVLATEAEPEGLEAHRLEGDVAGQHEEVGPGDLLAVLLLDRPQEAAGLVEVAVVGPAVERGEALVAVAATAAAVLDAVGAGRVPGEPDHERPVVAVVGGPPVLRRGHHLDEVLLQGVDVEALERLGVDEVLVHRVAGGIVLVEHRQVELVRPPVLVRARAAGGLGLRGVEGWVLAVRHDGVLLCCGGCFWFSCSMAGPMRHARRGSGPSR